MERWVSCRFLFRRIDGSSFVSHGHRRRVAEFEIPADGGLVRHLPRHHRGYLLNTFAHISID